MLGLERLAQQRVVEEVDLPHRQVVGRPPIGVDQLGFGLGKRLVARCGVLSALVVARCHLGHRRAFLPCGCLDGVLFRLRAPAPRQA